MKKTNLGKTRISLLLSFAFIVLTLFFVACEKDESKLKILDSTECKNCSKYSINETVIASENDEIVIKFLNNKDCQKMLLKLNLFGKSHSDIYYTTLNETSLAFFTIVYDNLQKNNNSNLSIIFPLDTESMQFFEPILNETTTIDNLNYNEVYDFDGQPLFSVEFDENGFEFIQNDKAPSWDGRLDNCIEKELEDRFSTTGKTIVFMATLPYSWFELVGACIIDITF
jgi:hypothetical protein